MKKLILLLSIIMLSSFVYCQKDAYIIYNSKGRKVSYKKMIRQLKKQDVVLFGEFHNNPISHWLQYEVSKNLNEERNLILGAEMFEADNQTFLTDYVKGKITFEQLDSLARLWPNYKTDYAPLVDFAKENDLEFIATNIPRRYARMVHKQDFTSLDSLSTKEKAWIAPLPIAFDPELPTYKMIIEMMGDHASPKLVKAQAIKDATMAHFILKNFKENHLFLHYNGAFHSDYYQGILWYLKNENKDLKYSTISTVSQENVSKLKEENEGKADFIICVDLDMTTTY